MPEVKGVNLQHLLKITKILLGIDGFPVNLLMNTGMQMRDASPLCSRFSFMASKISPVEKCDGNKKIIRNKGLLN